jgi:kynureninase
MGALELTREACLARDAADPVAGFRDRFDLPEGLIYLDGNSLGALPKAAAVRVRETVETEWGEGLIGSWNEAGWMDAPLRVGAKLAPLIGAGADEVVLADSTSVSLFKVLAAAATAARAEHRHVILTEISNFPTDLYVAENLVQMLGVPFELRRVKRASLTASLGPDVAVLMLTHVDFRTGEMHDMARLTGAAQAAGVLALWDLSHSAGAVPVDLNGVNADCAVGCGYKYLNGGPGAPAFIYVARRHHETLMPVISGWMGHARPFDFGPVYAPSPGIRRYVSGTPSILGLAALEAAVEIFLDVDMTTLRRKSEALTELFIALVDAHLESYGFGVVSPRDPARRGSQVALSHPHGYPIMRALIVHKVIGDFRAPDLLRFGFAPLYTRFVDVWDAVEELRLVMQLHKWQHPDFAEKQVVT